MILVEDKVKGIRGVVVKYFQDDAISIFTEENELLLIGKGKYNIVDGNYKYDIEKLLDGLRKTLRKTVSRHPPELHELAIGNFRHTIENLHIYIP